MDTTITVNTSITVGDIRHYGNHAAGTITINGSDSFTFSNSSENASIESAHSGVYDPTFWLGPYLINVPINIDVDTFTIGASVQSIGQMTAVGGRDVTVNANLRIVAQTYTNNDLGGGILNVSAVGAFLILDGPNSAGGSNTTIRILAGRCDFMNTTTKIGNIEVVANCQTVPNNVVVGSININSNKTWDVFTTTDQSTVRVASGETFFIDTDGLLYMHHFNNIRSGDIRISTNSFLTGFGTIVTLPSGTHAPHVYLESGATLNPGSTNVLTGIFHVGSATYPDTAVTLEPGAVMAFDLAGTVAGTDYDQVSVDGGTLVISNSVLNVASISTTYLLSDYLFLVAENGGSIAGTFTGVADGDTVEFSSEGKEYKATINYTGDEGTDSLTGGNDIVLSQIYSIPAGTLILIQ